MFSNEASLFITIALIGHYCVFGTLLPWDMDIACWTILRGIISQIPVIQLQELLQLPHSMHKEPSTWYFVFKRNWKNAIDFKLNSFLV